MGRAVVHVKNDFSIYNAITKQSQYKLDMLRLIDKTKSKKSNLPYLYFPHFHNRQ